MKTEGEVDLITPQVLEAAGWEKRRLWYWKTYRPLWKDADKREECCVRVIFNDDYFPELDFMVWFVAVPGSSHLPKIRTMEQLNTLLELVTG